MQNTGAALRRCPLGPRQVTGQQETGAATSEAALPAGSSTRHRTYATQLQHLPVQDHVASAVQLHFVAPPRGTLDACPCRPGGTAISLQKPTPLCCERHGEGQS